MWKDQIILDLNGALLDFKKNPLEPPFLLHFQPLIGQGGDEPVYVHQTAQNVELGDAPFCFFLGLTTLGLERFAFWILFPFSFYFT